MKKLFYPLALALSLSAQAAPDCWTVDATDIGKNKNGRELKDGYFLITVDTKAISKEDLLLVIDKVDFGNLKPDSFPQLFENVLIINTRATVADADKDKVDRPKLIETVGAQLDEIAAILGVTGVDCNGIERPGWLPARL